MVINVIYRILLYIVGVFLTSLGMVYITIKSSLFTMGYSLEEYIHYIIKQKEVYLLPIGLLIVGFTTYFDKTWKKIILLHKGR